MPRSNNGGSEHLGDMLLKSRLLLIQRNIDFRCWRKGVANFEVFKHLNSSNFRDTIVIRTSLCSTMRVWSRENKDIFRCYELPCWDTFSGWDFQLLTGKCVPMFTRTYREFIWGLPKKGTPFLNPVCSTDFLPDLFETKVIFTRSTCLHFVNYDYCETVYEIRVRVS